MAIKINTVHTDIRMMSLYKFLASHPLLRPVARQFNHQVPQQGGVEFPAEGLRDISVHLFMCVCSAYVHCMFVNVPFANWQMLNQIKTKNTIKII